MFIFWNLPTIIFQASFFRCYVSFRQGMFIFWNQVRLVCQTKIPFVAMGLQEWLCLSLQSLGQHGMVMGRPRLILIIIAEYPVVIVILRCNVLLWGTSFLYSLYCMMVVKI